MHVYVVLQSIEGAKRGCVILALCCLNCCCGQHGKAEECSFLVDMVIASVVRICVEMLQLVAVCSEAA